MRSAYLALIPFLVAAPAQAVEPATTPDSAARVQIAQGGPTDKRREVEKKREEERREKAEKERKRREAEARKRREAEQRRKAEAERKRKAADAERRRKAEAERRRKAEAERKKREAERRRRERRAATVRCHRGVPASMAYYQKCSLFGIPWGVSPADVQSILGRPPSSQKGSIFTYNRFRGRYDIYIAITSRGYIRMDLQQGAGLRITRAIRLGMNINTLARLLPGARKGARGESLHYRSGKLHVIFRCLNSWQYQCRNINVMKTY